jgi:hypothetical protein
MWRALNALGAGPQHHCNNFCCFPIIEKAEWRRRYATQLSPSIRKGFLVAGLLSKLNAKNSNLQIETIQQPFLFGRLPAEELACRKKQDYTEKGDQHPPCVCLWNRRNGRIVIFDVPILIAVVLAVVAFAVVRARERQHGEN